MTDGHDAHHPRVHVHQHMAVERPVADRVGREIEADLAAGQDVHRMLARIVGRILAGNELKEMAVDMDGVRHHRVVDEVHPHPLHMAEGDGIGPVRQLHSVEGPHIAFNVCDRPPEECGEIFYIAFSKFYMA